MFNRRIPACCFLINPPVLISFCVRNQWNWQATPRTEVIGWDRLESPSVNILLRTKLLSLDPLSWDMDCLLTLWPLLIPCSLGNRCCTFGFLIFIIVERNFLYNSLYILTERSLKHLCSIRAWVSVSFFLSFSLSFFLIVDSRLPGSGPLKDPNTKVFYNNVEEDEGVYVLLLTFETSFDITIIWFFWQVSFIKINFFLIHYDVFKILNY